MTYDFGLAWSGNVEEKFITFLKEACKERRLSFFWVKDDNIKDVLKKLDKNRVKIHVLLDTEATYNKKDDPYAKLCYLVKDKGGVVINDPDRTKNAVDKSIIHYELADKGVELPYTVVVRNWQPASFKLTDQERRKLGVPFIIKPATGYGQQGVERNARGTIREIATARNYDRGDNFLLQEKIKPVELNGKKAWFRVYNAFHTIIPCWWDDASHLYGHVEYEEFNGYRLYPLVKIVSMIADLTRMTWFSTEIAIDNRHGKTRFLPIDYVNDQCDMTTQTESANGVPDPVVKYTAETIVGNSLRIMNGDKIGKKYTVMLKDANIEIRGLGSPPDLLKQNPRDTFWHKRR